MDKSPAPSLVERLLNCLNDPTYTGASLVSTQLLGEAIEALTAAPAPEDAPLPTQAWCFDMEKAPRDGTEIDIWMSIGVRQADCRWGNPSRANWGDRYGRDQNLPEQWITRECVALDRRNGVPIAWMPLPPAPPTPAREG